MRTSRTWVTDVFLISVCVAIFVCCLAIQAATTRLLFAYGRDKMIPASRFFGYVHPRTKTPMLSAIFIGAAAIVVLLYVNLGGSDPFIAIARVTAWATAGTYIAYQMVVFGGLVARAKGWPKDEGLLQPRRLGLAGQHHRLRLRRVHDHQPGLADARRQPLVRQLHRRALAGRRARAVGVIVYFIQRARGVDLSATIHEIDESPAEAEAAEAMAAGEAGQDWHRRRDRDAAGDTGRTILRRIRTGRSEGPTGRLTLMIPDQRRTPRAAAGWRCGGRRPKGRRPRVCSGAEHSRSGPATRYAGGRLATGTSEPSQTRRMSRRRATDSRHGEPGRTASPADGVAGAGRAGRRSAAARGAGRSRRRFAPDRTGAVVAPARRRARRLTACAAPAPTSAAGAAVRRATSSGRSPCAAWRTVPDVPADQWTVKVDGLVDQPFTLDAQPWETLERIQETVDFNCVEGWTVANVRWGGVPPRSTGVQPEALCGGARRVRRSTSAACPSTS